MHKRFIYENVNSNIFIILYKKPISYTFHQATLMSHDEAILSGGGGKSLSLSTFGLANWSFQNILEGQRILLYLGSDYVWEMGFPQRHQNSQLHNVELVTNFSSVRSTSASHCCQSYSKCVSSPHF